MPALVPLMPESLTTGGGDDGGILQIPPPPVAAVLCWSVSLLTENVEHLKDGGAKLDGGFSFLLDTEHLYQDISKKKAA